MYLVLLKFTDVFARAVLVVGVSYLLPLGGAGQFGLVVTVVGFWAFAGNFDRHQDIQRRWAGHPPEVFDRVVAEAVPFWAVNQAVLFPFFVTALALLAQASWMVIVLSAAVLLGEQVSTWAYQMAMVDGRYRPLVLAATVKNGVVALAVLPRLLIAPGSLDVDGVLLIWAAAQVVGALAIALMWLRIKRNPPSGRSIRFRDKLLAQYRASGTHFLIGLVAMLTLQHDRLVIGALLPLESIGVYFRHVLIISVVYQFFTIASLNRVAPQVYACAREMPVAGMVALLRGEYLRVVLFVGVMAGLVLAVEAVSGGALAQRFSLSALLAAVLLTGALLRIAADYGAVVCNARLREALVLRAQVFAFVSGALAMVVLTPVAGLLGAATSTVVAGTIYCLLIAGSVQNLSQNDPELS